MPGIGGTDGAAADVDEDALGASAIASPTLDLVRRLEAAWPWIDRAAFAGLAASFSTPSRDAPATASLRALTVFMSTLTAPSIADAVSAARRARCARRRRWRPASWSACSRC